MNMPEMYDNINWVCNKDRTKTDEYYNTKRVLKLGEYAVQSLAENYKYNILPHYIARGGESKSRFVPLDKLRNIRIYYFFNDENLVDEIICFEEVYNTIITFIKSSEDKYFI